MRANINKSISHLISHSISLLWDYRLSQGSLAEAPQAAYGTLDQITEGSLRQVFSGPQLLSDPHFIKTWV